MSATIDGTAWTASRVAAPQTPIPSTSGTLEVNGSDCAPPDTDHFGEVDFGGMIEQERTFGGYTIPTRLKVGWFFGTPEFEKNGEFFRATVDDAVFKS